MVSVSQLNEMAAIASELQDQHAYETAMLACIGRMVGFDVAFFKRDGRTGPVVLGLDQHWVAEQEQQLFDCRQDAAGVIDAALQRHGVAVDLHVLGQRGLEVRRYYQALMKPAGGRSSAMFPVIWRGTSISMLTLGMGGRAHRVREVEEMERFAPTLQLCEAARHARQAAGLLGPNRARPRQLPSGLTPSERDVLTYLPLGYTNFDIAQARGTSLRTVRNQLSSAYLKLGIACRAEAVALLASEPTAL